ncbi:PKD domain-containing protein [Marinifilum sp.]|uniref:PKD domain-containing protein n=1 Tax=Marinifilum sp. TaxID=2033137 RepID=UPI003BAD7762
MRKILYLCILWLITLPVMAQNQIREYEYWIDGDIANRQLVVLSSPSSEVNISELLDINALVDGLHSVEIRFKDSNNAWSSVVNKQFVKRTASTASHQLSKMEYWFDNDIANAVTTSFTPTDQLNHSELIDLSSLSDGVHLLSYRIQDESKAWSSVVSKQFIKREAITTAQQLNTIQYWFDNDIENSVTSTFVATDELNHSELIDLTGLSDGIHLISYRIKAGSNTWSTVVSKQFIKREGNTQARQLTKVQYWFDNDIENVVSNNIASTDRLDMNELIDLADLTEGLHTIHARVMDESNIWSTVVSKQFVKRPALIAAKLQQYRYWLNDDIKNAELINIDPLTEQFSVNEMVDILSIPPGADQSICYQFKDDQGNWSVPVSQTINRIAVVKASFTADITEHCGPTTVQFTNNSTDGETYQWDFGDGNTSTEENPNHTYEASGSFTVSLTTTNDTYSKSDVSTMTDFITIHTIPTVDLGADIQICEGSEHTFSIANSFEQYFWNDASGSNEFTTGIAGDYTLRVVDANGCEASDLANLSFFTTPTVDLGADIQICEGSEHTFSVEDNFVQYFWNDVEGSNEFTGSTEGNITLRVVDANACEASDMVNLSFFPAPTVNLGADIQICEGSEHTFSVEDNFIQYFWNDVEGSNELIANAEGNYTLRVVDANGCEASDVVNLSFFSSPTVNLGNDIQICEGNEHTFSVEDNFVQYFWNDIEGSNELIANVEGNYALRVIDANGCEATDAVNLSFFTNPIIDLGDDVAICDGDEHTFSVEDNFAQYFWNDLEGSNELIADTEGNYTLHVIDANGCEASDQATLSINDLPIVDLGDDQTACKGEEIVLSVEDNHSKYFWNNTEGSSQITVTANGDYQLRVVDNNGCEANDAVTVTFLDVPDIDLGNDVDVCEGETFSFNVSDQYAQYFWNDVEGNHTFDVSATGTYTLRVVADNGCSASDEASVTFQDLPVQPVVSYLDGILSSSYEEEYQWYLNNEILSGQTSQEFTPEQDGNYSVEVWSQYGCKSERSEKVEVILVGIEDLIKENISIYPNPTKGKVVIDLSKNFDYNTDIQLKLFDASGKLIIQQKLNPITTIDLSSYSAGLYFIHFINQSEILSFKIIRQ